VRPKPIPATEVPVTAFTPADEKALALVYAYEALVKSLADTNVLDMDVFFRNLSGAQVAAQRVGETGAADLLGSLATNLQRI
jgi:hypothetical protein